ncbi:MAG: hypothetical protein LW870_23265, partial [Pirellula sp.]|nr:hypothetical protein [Pirellula sp.]
MSSRAAVPAAQERGVFWGRTHRLGLACAIVADTLWGHRWPTDAMSARGDAWGSLQEISRQCATSCETRRHAGVAKFRREGQGRWLGCIGQFEASRSVTEQDSNTGSPRGFDCIECAG